jgi:choline transport protein
MCEEIKNASTVVPHSLLASIAINGTLGFSMLIAILFCVGDIENALNTPTGFPFIEIFTQAARSNGGATAMVSVVLSLMIFCSVATLAASSRVMWAFARDNGIPGSSYLAYVEPRTKLPLYAISLSTLITMLFGLINIGSSAAFNAVASLVVAGFLGSYILPIGLLLYNRISNPSGINYGPFTLGRFGIATNIFALLWTILVMVFSFFPAAIPITLSTMNWSCLLWGGTMIFGFTFYIFYQRGRYHGPIVETSVLEHMNGV